MLDYITSTDGTQIAYRKYGSHDNGPALIMVHGWLEHSASHQDLAKALSGRFTVICPERRGRGHSADYGPNYGLDREVEDVAVLAEKYDARLIFGVNIGASIALQACKDLDCFDKALLYEPCLSGYFAADWLDDFRQALGKGKYHNALAIVDKESQLGRYKLALLPAGIRQRILKAYLDMEKLTCRDNPSVESMIPGLELELQIARETLGWQDGFGGLRQDFLLLGGQKSPAMLREGLNALEMVLPKSAMHIFANLDNNGSGNLNLGGMPMFVASRMASFLGPIKKAQPAPLVRPIRIDLLTLPALSGLREEQRPLGR